MNEFENPNPAPENDPYTYYAGQSTVPAEYRYIPQSKKKKCHGVRF